MFAEGFNDQFFYIVLYGRLKLFRKGETRPYGQTLNLGWTIGEEILFKGENPSKAARTDTCKAI